MANIGDRLDGLPPGVDKIEAPRVQRTVSLRWMGGGKVMHNYIIHIRMITVPITDIEMNQPQDNNKISKSRLTCICYHGRFS